MDTKLILDEAPRARDSLIHAYSVQDVEPILENNKLLRSMPQKSDFGRHIAEIPNVVCLQWIEEERQRGHEIQFMSAEFKELVKRKIRDPDYAYLRTDK